MAWGKGMGEIKIRYNLIDEFWIIGGLMKMLWNSSHKGRVGLGVVLNPWPLGKENIEDIYFLKIIIQ